MEVWGRYVSDVLPLFGLEFYFYQGKMIGNIVSEFWKVVTMKKRLVFKEPVSSFQQVYLFTLNALLTGDLIHWTKWVHLSVLNTYLRMHLYMTEKMFT